MHAARGSRLALQPSPGTDPDIPCSWLFICKLLARHGRRAQPPSLPGDPAGGCSHRSVWHGPSCRHRGSAGEGGGQGHREVPKGTLTSAVPTLGSTGALAATPVCAAPSAPAPIPAPRFAWGFGGQPQALVASGTPGHTEQRTEPCQPPRKPQIPVGSWQRCWGQTPRDAGAGLPAPGSAVPGSRQSRRLSRLVPDHPKTGGKAAPDSRPCFGAEISRSPAGAAGAAAASARGLSIGQQSWRFGSRSLRPGQAVGGKVPWGWGHHGDGDTTGTGTPQGRGHRGWAVGPPGPCTTPRAPAKVLGSLLAAPVRAPPKAEAGGHCGAGGYRGVSARASLAAGALRCSRGTWHVPGTAGGSAGSGGRGRGGPGGGSRRAKPQAAAALPRRGSVTHQDPINGRNCFVKYQTLVAQPEIGNRFICVAGCSSTLSPPAAGTGLG